jgi:ABC-type transport system involved in multi-copper enzyme maturation permease subunit
MFTSLLFGALAASISIAEEIEGRTAITVMSKPINRRSFLVGKFLGIVMACAAMSLVLQVNLNFALVVAPEFDQINLDKSFDPMPEQAKSGTVPAVQAVFPAGPAKLAAEGIGRWAGEVFAHAFGLLLGFGQVMILVAIATALATRLPFVVNLVVVLFVYFFGHLAPVIARVTAPKAGAAAADRSTGEGLIHFLAQLFDTLLPSLEPFGMGPAIIRDTTLDLWAFIIYVLTVFGYAVIYTVIVLIIGLLLFEDRDLA